MRRFPHIHAHQRPSDGTARQVRHLPPSLACVYCVRCGCVAVCGGRVRAGVCDMPRPPPPLPHVGSVIHAPAVACAVSRCTPPSELPHPKPCPRPLYHIIPYYATEPCPSTATQCWSHLHPYNPPFTHTTIHQPTAGCAAAATLLPLAPTGHARALHPPGNTCSHSPPGTPTPLPSAFSLPGARRPCSCKNFCPPPPPPAYGHCSARQRWVCSIYFVYCTVETRQNGPNPHFMGMGMLCYGCVSHYVVLRSYFKVTSKYFEVHCMGEKRRKWANTPSCRVI